MAVLLTACSSGYAPVSDLTGGSRTSPRISKGVSPPVYTVKSGDTLYSIAWRYGLDYRQLARANNIKSDFVIYRGQRLKLRYKPQIQTKVASNSSSVNASNKVSQKTVISKKSTSEKTRKNSNKGNENKPLKSTAQEKNKTLVSSQAVQKVSRWRWPAAGKVVSRFSSKNKGIDISGNQGDPVFAAADGKVVYAGNGILGYGNLIIINHNEEYLSAYAHNSVILVVENDRIKAGKKIAEIGSSGTIQTILHFEVRRDGKPVNPLNYLPRR
ncbi:MAG: peptidoglycan DD-metalloendopeptidase family protein [Pseudomonadales bacterium]